MIIIGNVNVSTYGNNNYGDGRDNDDSSDDD